MIYNDRLFFQYNELYKFSRNEMLSICEKECKFYENILDDIQPDCIIIKNTDSRRSHLLKMMCNARNIKSLMLHRTRIGYKSTISETYDKKIKLSRIDQNFNETNDVFDLEKFKKENMDFKQKEKNVVSATTPITRKIKPVIMWLLKPLEKEYKESYVHFGISKFNVLKIQIFTHIKKIYRKKSIDKNLRKVIPMGEKFIYFPLHRQPERSISIDSPIHNNQLEIITNIAKSIPVNYFVYVKEHPDQKIYTWRPSSFYQQLLDLPNVKIFHPLVKTSELFDKCSMVATITGTSGLESSFYEKPSMVFTDTSYSDLPHVTRVTNLEQLPKDIRETLDKKIDLKLIQKFVGYYQSQSFDVNIHKIINEILDKFHNGNVTIRRDISMIELERFFDENKKEFDKIAMEHIKKMMKK